MNELAKAVHTAMLAEESGESRTLSAEEREALRRLNSGSERGGNMAKPQASWH
jgi:hypothetical protein